MVAEVCASSTLVNVAEDAELRLIRLLADSAPPSTLNASFVQDCEACIVNADAARLIKTVVNDPGAISALFVMEPADEAVSAFSLLAALIDRVGDGDEIKASKRSLTQDLSKAVGNVKVAGKQPVQLVERQISLLSVLYNMRPDVNDKCALLTKMITLAGSFEPTKQMLEPGQPIGRLLHDEVLSRPSAEQESVSNILTPDVPLLVSMLDAWEIPSAERRNIYHAVAQGVIDPAMKQRFMLLLAKTYKQPQVDDKGVQAAKEAALGAIRDPVTLFVHQRNMLAFPAIQALSKKNATLYGLLKVFQEGKLEDYTQFVKDNGGEKNIVSLGLDPKECTRYMRILSLCTLASQYKEIPYSKVKDTLLLSESELGGDADMAVESWVIAAVSSQLLTAKMDQLKKTVMVERCVVRKFDIEQWKILQKKLKDWKENVGNVINGLKQANQVSAAAIAAGSNGGTN